MHISLARLHVFYAVGTAPLASAIPRFSCESSFPARCHPTRSTMSSECTPISSTVATTLSGGESPVMNRQRTSSSGGISSSAGSSYGSRRGTFAKIRLCKFYEHGLCWHGDDCAYAHGEDELRRPPDLRKTKLCHQFRLGRCSQGSDCPYAHGRSELRCTPEVYKTSLCRFWLKGKCGATENCRHAHGEADLRGGQTGSSSPSATAPSVQSAVSLSIDGRVVPPDSVGTDSDDTDKLTEKLYHLIDELATCPELKHMSTYLRSCYAVAPVWCEMDHLCCHDDTSV